MQRKEFLSLLKTLKNRGNMDADHMKVEQSGKDNSQCGWTFIETLIVIAIGIILTGSIGFIGFRYIDKAKSVNAVTTIENLTLALNTYFMDCKRFPTNEQGLDALWQKPILSPMPDKWSGPYVAKPIPTDPWGTPYVYSNPGPNGLPFAISSLGADGIKGGEKNEKDITSWEN